MNTVSVFPEPAWEVSRLFPAQGAWTEQEYLDLPGNHLVEFNSGSIEVLNMPSLFHQLLVAFLYELLVGFVRQHELGLVLFAPIPVKLWQGKIREPDIVFMRREHMDRCHENYLNGADLVMEVVSPDDPGRDKITKRHEYAKAGIPEYWLIDPAGRTVTVFNSPDGAGEYAVQGVFNPGAVAASATLEGFSLDVAGLFAAADDMNS